MIKYTVGLNEGHFVLMKCEPGKYTIVAEGTYRAGDTLFIPRGTVVVHEDDDPVPLPKFHFLDNYDMDPKDLPKQASKPVRPFDLDAALQGEKVLLRSGHTARIVHHNPNADRSDTAVLGYSDAEELMTWNDDGEFATGDSPRPEDIVGMAPRIETREGWINVYPAHGPAAALHPTKESADRLARPTRIASVRIEYTVEARHG